MNAAMLGAISIALSAPATCSRNLIDRHNAPRRSHAYVECDGLKPTIATEEHEGRKLFENVLIAVAKVDAVVHWIELKP